MNHIPTIIGVADSTHYLVGEADTKGDFMAFSPLNDVIICASLSQAKSLLKDNNVHEAQLILETAYDEMCGLPAFTDHPQMLHL